jgi:hypothetical protein
VQFKLATHKIEGVLDYIHYDVWGPVNNITGKAHVFLEIH